MTQGVEGKIKILISKETSSNQLYAPIPKSDDRITTKETIYTSSFVEIEIFPGDLFAATEYNSEKKVVTDEPKIWEYELKPREYGRLPFSFTVKSINSEGPSEFVLNENTRHLKIETERSFEWYIYELVYARWGALLTFLIATASCINYYYYLIKMAKKKRDPPDPQDPPPQVPAV